MGQDICRAISFVNYHIPLPVNLKTDIPYSTVGFFDGLFTERLCVDYKEHNLKALWRYTLKRTANSNGHYSHQNIFGFSRDEWNTCSDADFWKEEADRKLPLLFIIFLQTGEYVLDSDTMERQCRLFSGAASKMIGAENMTYVYSTIDKNDFVVCIRCRNYERAVSAVKALHTTKLAVVYSYTVFSISNNVLKTLEKGEYEDIYGQKIDSITLKGITNSYDPDRCFALDQKYADFCKRLVDRLYDGDRRCHAVYDILGDNDFRLVAEDVSLGRLLQQFAPGEMLNYGGKEFRFYLFSTNLVMNIPTRETGRLEETDKENNIAKMEREFRAPVCDSLQQSMEQIARVVKESGDGTGGGADERVVTFCHAIWQLLQSLKALEMAPTKKYDFWSLYHPFSALINILEKKMEDQTEPYYENSEIYNFIHKFSMTLHGTLRTDIQFFQIRDFNVTIHYAPAKLRAFYSLWALKLSDYYNAFCPETNKYSFIFSPGMFQGTSVQELFDKYDETERLMLITIPERHLYSPKCLAVILAHEVSHFVGYEVRCRYLRHSAWIECSAKVLALELNHYRYYTNAGDYRDVLRKKMGEEPRLYKWLKERLNAEEKTIRGIENKWPHEFHSENSIRTIERALRKVGWQYIEKFLADDSELMYISFVKEDNNISNLPFKARIEKMDEMREAAYEPQKQLMEIYRKFQQNAMHSVLEIVRYITTEAYADLTAILTLNLNPAEYLLSFINSELSFYKTKTSEQENSILLAPRMGMAQHAVIRIVKDNEEWFRTYCPQFYQEWSGDVFRTLPLLFRIDTPACDLAINVYGYVTGIRDCENNIESYQSLYDDREETFSNTSLDFLNDRVVWNALSDYLYQCACVYVKTLREKNGLLEVKMDLEGTYSRISGDSLTDMMLEIERFLADYEKAK